jgi:hypothetical protein
MHSPTATNGTENRVTGCQVHVYIFFFSFSLFLTYFLYHVGVGAVPNGCAQHNGHERDRRYGLPGAPKIFFFCFVFF